MTSYQTCYYLTNILCIKFTDFVNNLGLMILNELWDWGMSQAALKLDGGPLPNEIIGLDKNKRRNRRHGKESHETKSKGRGSM